MPNTDIWTLRKIATKFNKNTIILNGKKIGIEKLSAKLWPFLWLQVIEYQSEADWETV